MISVLNHTSIRKQEKSIRWKLTSLFLCHHFYPFFMSFFYDFSVQIEGFKLILVWSEVIKYATSSTKMSPLSLKQFLKTCMNCTKVLFFQCCSSFPLYSSLLPSVPLYFSMWPQLSPLCLSLKVCLPRRREILCQVGFTNIRMVLC